MKVPVKQAAKGQYLDSSSHLYLKSFESKLLSVLRLCAQIGSPHLRFAVAICNYEGHDDCAPARKKRP